MNIVERLELAGHNLIACLCPEKNHLPYWHMVVADDLSAAYEFRRHCTGHNVGRWWNAMLRLQHCTGFELPETIEAAMLENTWQLSDNPTGVLLEDPDPGDIDSWYVHSYRETMLALGLLVQFRKSDRAKQQGLCAIDQMGKATRDPAQCDLTACNIPSADLKLTGHAGEPAYNHGRAIEGLLCFHEATGASEALAEAERLADFHFAHTVQPYGHLAAGCGHHTHSYLNTVRGLLMLAQMKGQQARLQTIRATYANAIAGMITQSGFTTHDIGATSGGDIASAGDIAHIALLLWDCFEDSELLDDAERIVRCRLLPAQVRERLPLKPTGDTQQDCYRDLPERFRGAIGGSVGQVRGQTCVTDFTAAALHSLIELYQRTIDVEDSCIRINFHFDCVRSGVQVESVRGGTTARLTVNNETGKKTAIRIPAWTPTSSLQLLVDDMPSKAVVSQGFLHVPGNARGTSITLRYALPETTTQETWRDGPAEQESVRFRWRGDEIIDVEPGGCYMAAFAKPCGSFGH